MGIDIDVFLERNAQEIIQRRRKGTYGYRQLAEDYGISTRQARKIGKRLKALERGAPKVSFDDNGNTANLSFSGGQGELPTAEELLEIAGLDPADWYIEDVESGAWHMGRKDRQTDLTWTDGKMEGSVNDSGQIHRAPLHRITVKAKRRVLVNPSLPALKRVEVRLSGKTRVIPVKRKLKLALVVGDSQNGYRRDIRTGKFDPFHDRRVWDLFVQLAAYLQPDRIIYGGDMIDLPEWSSRWTTEPEFYYTTQAALEELAWWFGQVRVAAPHSRGDWVEGNHDVRMHRSIIENAKAAYGLKRVDAVDGVDALSLENLLALEHFDITYHGGYPEGEVWLNEALRVVHGDIAKAKPGHTASAYAQEGQASTIFHHVHRRERASHTKPSTRQLVEAINPGCACRLDGVVPGSSPDANWQQGFLLVEYDPDGSYYQLHPISVEEGRARYDGRDFIARDRLAELHRDLPGWNW